MSNEKGFEKQVTVRVNVANNEFVVGGLYESKETSNRYLCIWDQDNYQSCLLNCGSLEFSSGDDFEIEDFKHLMNVETINYFR